MLSQSERLFKAMCEAAIEVQSLALRLSNCSELSKATRSHGEFVAQAGRTIALACVALNHGQNPRELKLFYGQWLSQRGTDKVNPSALSEEGVDAGTLTKSLAGQAKSERMRGVPQPRQTLAALAERRAKLQLNTAAAATPTS